MTSSASAIPEIKILHPEYLVSISTFEIVFLTTITKALKLAATNISQTLSVTFLMSCFALVNIYLSGKILRVASLFKGG